MSSKQSCFKSLIISNVKHYIWIPLLAAFIALLTSVFPLYMSFNFVTGDSLYSYGIDENSFYFLVMPLNIVLAATGMISAMFLTKYNDAVSSVSFMHSLPTTRTRLFFVNLISAAIHGLIPVLVTFLIFLGSLSYGVELSWILKTVGPAYIIFLLFYSITYFVSTLTGVTFVKPVFAGILMLLPMFIEMFIDTLCNEHLFGFAGDRFSIFEEYLYLSDYDLRTPLSLIYVGLAVFFLAMSLLIYKKRNLENSGDVIAFPFLIPVFNTAFGFCSGILGYYYLYLFWGTENIFFMIIFCAIGVFIANAIANKKLKFKGTLKPLLINLGLIIVLVAVFVFDITGFENRIPSIDKVKSVKILNWEENGGGYDRINNEYVSYTKIDTYKPEFTNKEDIEKIKSLHSKFIELKSDEEYHVVYDTIEFEYTLENGTKLKREYYFNEYTKDKLDNELNELYNTDVYRKSQYPIIDGTEKEYKGIVVNTIGKPKFIDGNVSYTSNILAYDKELTSDISIEFSYDYEFLADSDEFKKILEALTLDRESISYEQISANRECGDLTQIEVIYKVPVITEHGKKAYVMETDVYNINKGDINTYKVLEELELIESFDLSIVTHCVAKVYSEDYEKRETDNTFVENENEFYSEKNIEELYDFALTGIDEYSDNDDNYVVELNFYCNDERLFGQRYVCDKSLVPKMFKRK